MLYKCIRNIPNKEAYSKVKEKLKSLGEKIHESINNDDIYHKYPMIGITGSSWCGYMTSSTRFSESEMIDYSTFMGVDDWKNKLSELFNEKIKRNVSQIQKG